MIKRTITYTNFADETVTEDWYFHMSKAEAIQLEASEKGGLSETLKAIIAEENSSKLFVIFKDLLKHAVGERSVDGKRFSKSYEITAGFTDSGACDQLIFDLLTNGEAAAAFFTGFLPKDVQQQAAGPKIEMPAQAVTPRPKLSIAEVQAMNSEDFKRLGDIQI